MPSPAYPFASRSRSRGESLLGGGGGFSPIDIADLWRWFDADDDDSIVEDTGRISQWSDKSGNDFHVTQASASNRPVKGTDGGLKAVFTDGSSRVLTDLLQPITPTEATIFSAGRHNSVQPSIANHIGMRTSGGSAAFSLGLRGDTGGGSATLVYFSPTNSAQLQDALFNVDQVRFVSGSRVDFGGSGNAETRIDGQTIDTFNAPTVGASNDWNEFNVCAANQAGAVSADAYIHEVIVYLRKLTVEEFEQVLDYLAAKWDVNPI